MNTSRKTKCKICGAPRWLNCDRALCEQHFLRYLRENGRACYRRKQARIGKTVKPSSNMDQVKYV